jgi:hypothetical protein
LYNAVLGIEVVILVALLAANGQRLPLSVPPLRFCEWVVLDSLAANGLFLLGHYFNSYLMWLGFRQRIYTALIFFGGLLIAGGLAALAILAPFMPD